MTLSIEDSILRLKAEIIAQDWRLSPKRAEQLESAFRALLDHFKDRKATHAMLVMAANVLEYIKNRGTSPPETIDFLKEAMAHIVSLHEDLADDQAKEEEIFQTLFARFTALKEKIQQKSAGKLGPGVSARAESGQAPRDSDFSPRDISPEDETIFLLQLIDEFKSSLSRAGQGGQALNRLLAAWIDSPAVAAILRSDPGPERAVPRRAEQQGATPCPPTKVRTLTISGLTVAIQSSVIAMIRPVSPAKATAYLQNATVPIKDFARFFGKLSGLFSGSLALVKEQILRELNLPILIPQGHEFPEAPPPEFKTLMVISNGNWHGVLACDDIRNSDQTMTQFAKRHNGDLAGVAYLEDGGQIPLLDPLPMLRREGILLMR